jgi:gamma-glutamyl-gamma-aminobutyrate hydrolase PuuD
MRRFFVFLTSVVLLAGCAALRTVSAATDSSTGGDGQGKAAAASADATTSNVQGQAAAASLDAQPTSPLIGISCGGDVVRASLKTTYIDAVRLAGGIPVLIPLLRDSVAMDALVRRLDGVILSGGEDIDPQYFGEEHLPELGAVNAPRDTADVLLIQIALRQGKPMLGICRGEQVINVVLGGSLWQDIPSQIPSSELKHRQAEPSTVATQAITIDPSSRLAEILGVTQIAVNSHHHQAVKDLAPGLVVTARAEDGVVEAYEGIPTAKDPYGQPFGNRVLAVQFHPEAFAQAGDPTFLKIFQDLVRRASSQIRH